MNAITKVLVALTLSALAGLAAVSFGGSHAEPAPSAPAKCTAVLAPGESC